MSARVRLGAYMDRASFQMGGLAGAEGLFDLRQILVAVVHFLLGSSAHREICLDHITAIELGGLFASVRVLTQHKVRPCTSICSQASIFSRWILARTAFSAVATAARGCSRR